MTSNVGPMVWRLTRQERATQKMEAMESTIVRLEAVIAVSTTQTPLLLAKMYTHYNNLVEALSKVVSNEDNDATNGVIFIEGHEAIDKWENAGFASLDKAWRMRHHLDHFIEMSRRN